MTFDSEWSDARLAAHRPVAAHPLIPEHTICMRCYEKWPCEIFQALALAMESCERRAKASPEPRHAPEGG